MKKALLILLSVLMAASLFACGGQENPPAKETTDKSSASSAEATTLAESEEVTVTTEAAEEITTEETTEEKSAETEKATEKATEKPTEKETTAEAEETTTEKPTETETEAATETTAPAETEIYEIMLSPMDIAGNDTNAASKGVLLSLADDGSYLHFERTVSSADIYIMLLNGNTSVTVKYLVIKYRTDHMSSGQIWANTTSNGHDNGSAKFSEQYATDDDWHVLAIDLSQALPSHVKADANGKYTVQWSRIDVLDTNASTGYFDLAYAVYCDDITDAHTFLSESDKALCSHSLMAKNADGEDACAVCKRTQKEIESDPGFPLDPASGYTASTVPYVACLDMVNGKGMNGTDKFNGRGSNTLVGVDSLNFNRLSGLIGNRLLISGWCIIEGGVDKYLWSADGGKTWNEIVYVASNERPEIKNGSADHIRVAEERLKTYKFIDTEASIAYSVFQTALGSGVNATGIAADLSAYAGQTVNVTFCAVPKSAPNTLCPIVHIKGVTVPAN